MLLFRRLCFTVVCSCCVLMGFVDSSYAQFLPKPSHQSPATPLQLPTPRLQGEHLKMTTFSGVLVQPELHLNTLCSALTTRNSPLPGQTMTCDGMAGAWIIGGAVISGAISAVPLLLNIIALNFESQTFRLVSAFLGIGGTAIAGIFTVASFVAWSGGCDGDIPLIGLSIVALAANIAVIWLSVVNLLWKPKTPQKGKKQAFHMHFSPTILPSREGVVPGLAVGGTF